MPRLFSYLMTHDSGFAPNPFHGTLTLATCKPGIRRTKHVGDWVAGFASHILVNNSAKKGVKINYQGLVYLMQISAVLSFDEYFVTPEFQCKKPSPSIDIFSNMEHDYGDNIYSHDGFGKSLQLSNGNHDEGDIEHDMSGERVLISDNFYYFGRKCPVPDGGWINASFHVPVGPTNYGYESDEVAINNISFFLRNFEPGRHGDPCLWADKKDESQGRSGCSR